MLGDLGGVALKGSASSGALATGRVGSYTLQAAIAAVHAAAPTAEATDWARIAELYGLLLQTEPSPVVELNRAVAVAMRGGPASGLSLIDAILDRGELTDFRLARSARAELCRRLGRSADARASFNRALDGLHPPENGARVSFRGGKARVTYGPFAESKEVLGGYWLIQAKPKEEAIEWARQCPADGGDVIEIRQVFEGSDWPEEARGCPEGSRKLCGAGGTRRTGEVRGNLGMLLWQVTRRTYAAQLPGLERPQRGRMLF